MFNRLNLNILQYIHKTLPAYNISQVQWACWSLLNCIQHLYYCRLEPYMQAIPYYGLQFLDVNLEPYLYIISGCQFIVSLCQFWRLRQCNISLISIQHCHYFSLCACFSCKQIRNKTLLEQKHFLQYFSLVEPYLHTRHLAARYLNLRSAETRLWLLSRCRALRHCLSRKSAWACMYRSWVEFTAMVTSLSAKKIADEYMCLLKQSRTVARSFSSIIAYAYAYAYS